MGYLISLSWLIIKYSQAPKKFKHAVDFGVEGNLCRENIELFKQKIKDHITDLSTWYIEGTYRKKTPALHFYNETNNLNVVFNVTNGEFITAWELVSNQVKALKTNKNVT